MNTPDVDDPAIMPMVCMRDKKNRVYPAPIVYHSVELCERELMHAAKYGKDVNGRPPLFAEYPHDFELVLVGRFDSRSGAIFPCNEIIAQVSDILKAE